MKNESIPSLTELSKTLKQLLPAELAHNVDKLINALVNILYDKDEVYNHEEGQDMLEILRFLSGKSVATSQSLISFGADSNFGDISIGDIARGSIIKMNFNIYPQSNVESKVVFQDDEEAKHKLRLLEIHRKRLFVLEEQAAYFGSSCPPHILMEINDINGKIGKIQYKA